MLFLNGLLPVSFAHGRRRLHVDRGTVLLWAELVGVVSSDFLKKSTNLI